MNAYDKTYLEEAMTNFAAMIDCGSRMEGSLDKFFDRLLVSKVAKQFECGNPRYIAGLSGIELANIVISSTGGKITALDYELGERTPEFWTGWALAYLQWYTGYSFEKISKSGLTAARILPMYPAFHEADLSKFVKTATRIMREGSKNSQSALKRQRKLASMTQRQLSTMSGVSLRMIRAYEQRSQDISKAEACTVLNLAHVLGCSPENILDLP